MKQNSFNRMIISCLVGIMAFTALYAMKPSASSSQSSQQSQTNDLSTQKGNYSPFFYWVTGRNLKKAAKETGVEQPGLHPWTRGLMVLLLLNESFERVKWYGISFYNWVGNLLKFGSDAKTEK